MTADRFHTRTRGAERRREAAREIREELERIRRSEARIAEALGSARAARQRVEELVRSMALEDQGVREIVREELRAANGRWSAQASDLPEEAAAAAAPFGSEVPEDETYAADVEDAADTESDLEPETVRPQARRPFWLLAVAALSVFVVASVGWLAYRTFNGPEEEPTLTVGGDSALPLGGPDAGTSGPVPEDSGALASADPDEDEPRDTERFFEMLPESATARAAVYDSLWRAHSEVFSPLLEQVEGATQESTVRRAIDAWRDGTASPLQRDLIHSALVQYSLQQQTGADLVLDGQLLRNPCRGASCSALLNFWENRGSAYGLPPVPEDAPRNTGALRMAESVLVLRTLEDVHLTRATNGG